MEPELDPLQSIRQKYDQISARKRDGFQSQNNWNTRGETGPNNNHEPDDISDGESHVDSQTPMFPLDEFMQATTSYPPPNRLNIDGRKGIFVRAKIF